jgi:predicted regulator of Ras-like GTPase activity (Roadblock/LC7/MglB family)
MPTAFTPILERAVSNIPGAIGAIFADWDGEAVDHFPPGETRSDRESILILGAHYGIVLNHMQSALHLFHFGEAEEVIVLCDRMDLVVHAVGEGYYVVLALNAGVHLATALREVRTAASALRTEMY